MLTKMLQLCNINNIVINLNLMDLIAFKSAPFS